MADAAAGNYNGAICRGQRSSRDREREVIERIRWHGHGSFTIAGCPLIQIAPWRVVKGERAPDVILIGHDVFGHCSPADVDKVRDENTLVIGDESVARVIPGAKALRAWQSISVDRASVTAIPATRRPGAGADGRLGFLISLDLFDLYYAGECEVAPTAAHFQPDILLLPIDGYGRLSVEAAAAMVELMQPRWAIPYNWGGTGEEATQLDAQSFQRRVSSQTEVVLLPVNP